MGIPETTPPLSVGPDLDECGVQYAWTVQELARVQREYLDIPIEERTGAHWKWEAVVDRYGALLQRLRDIHRRTEELL